MPESAQIGNPEQRARARRSLFRDEVQAERWDKDAGPKQIVFASFTNGRAGGV